MCKNEVNAADLTSQAEINQLETRIMGQPLATGNLGSI